MKKNSWKKYVGFTALALVVFLGSYVFIRNVVFGRYNPTEPYIISSTVSKPGITVTEQADAATPAAKPEVVTGGAVSDGSVSEPSPSPSASPLPEIPTAIGEKGTATNPFVILEIVPDKSLQTLSYLVQGSEPFNLSEMSRDQNLLDNNGDYTPNWRNNLSSFFNVSWAYDGVWFKSDYVNAIGSGNNVGHAVNDGAYKNHGQAAAFSVRKVFECDASSFSDPVFDGLSQADKDDYKTKYGRAYDLQYTSVTPEMKAATQNWKITSSTKSEKKSGYMVRVEAGKGTYRYQAGTGFIVAVNQNEKTWDFVEDKPSTGNDITVAMRNDQNKGNNAVVGEYTSITNFSVPLKHYVYHEITNNNVLEHMIFRFDTAEDYHQFHSKVIVVTPEELNEMALYDDASTMDYVERADMYYVQDACISADSFADQGIKIYQKYAAHSNETKSSSTIEHFSDGHDIEWANCLKMIQRLGDDPCLPILYGTSLGMDGNSTYQAHTYYSNNNSSQKCRKRQSVLSNVLKMFSVTTEFDLLARKTDGVERVDNAGKVIDGSTFYPKRTFMEDIFPQLKQAQLTTQNGNSFYTGYYSRPQCAETSVSADEKEKANYLWNKYTFLPISENLSDGDLTNKETMINLGYSQYIVSKMFTQDGDIGKLGLGRPSGAEYGNVLGVGAQNSAENKWMVDTTVFNNTGTVLYEILNGLFLKAKPLEVKVDDAIEDPDDTTVGVTSAIMFVDYDAKASYRSGIKIKINFHITNRNNLEGLMNLYAVSQDGNRKLIKAVGQGNDITVPAGEEKEDSSGVKYVVAKTTNYSVEFSLDDWLGKNSDSIRYTQLQFKGVGYHKFEGLPKKRSYSTYTLDIAERALFNLE